MPIEFQRVRDANARRWFTFYLFWTSFCRVVRKTKIQEKNFKILHIIISKLLYWN